MNNNEYTVTMPYKEFEKWQKMEEEYKDLKSKFEVCFKVDELERTVDVQSQDLIKLFKKISPTRFEDYNYAIR